MTTLPAAPPAPEPADEQTLALISDAVAAYARPDPDRARRVRDGAEGLDAKTWRDMAEQGWLGVLAPEALGGLDIGLAAAAAIARRLGYAAFPEPYVPVAVLAARTLALCPEAPMRDDLLSRLVAGDLRAGVAWQGPGGGLDAAAPPVCAAAAPDGLRLEGEVRFIPVPRPQGLIVSAAEADGLSLHWVETDLPGVETSVERAADGTPSLRARFGGVKVAESRRLAPPGQGAAILRAAVAEGAVAVSAQLTGLIERALELTLDHLRTREQFDRPIGGFQALQHRAVDLWIQKELARTTLEATLKTFADPAAGLDQREAAASSLKARASAAARQVAGQAVQLHGAIGFTDEHELGLHVNRALTLSAWLGNAAEHQRRFAARAGLASSQEIPS